MAGTDIARRESAGALARESGPRKVIFENARILFRNFEGKEGQYNREGDRNFALVLDNSVAEQMKDDGWNVKYLRARDENEEPQAYMQVAVSSKNRPPRIVMITSRGRTDLPEDMWNILDWVDIKTVDLIVNPYQWTVNGRSGTKAYLGSIYVTILEDELEQKYASVPEVEGSADMLQYTQDLTNSIANDDSDAIEAEIIEED